MPANDPSRKALENALNRRKELSDTIRKSLQEIERIEEFLKAYRVYSGIEEEGALSESQVTAPSLGRAGVGLTQPMFEHFVREILRERGEPLQAGEFVDEFRRIGFPIGGTNESKQTWNRLWQAKVNGVLVHFPRPGYWLADEPVPESTAVRNKAAVEAGLMEKPERRQRSHRYPGGKRRGRPSIVTDAQMDAARKMLMEEGKTFAQVSTELGGISQVTLRKHLGKDFLERLRQKRAERKLFD